jgi:hypothetical protein
MAFWLTESLRKFLSTNQESAKFLLIGSGELEEGKFGYGIFCATDNEFTAYRAQKLISQNQDNEVQIFPNTPSVREELSRLLAEIAAREEKPSMTEKKVDTAKELIDSVPNVLESNSVSNIPIENESQTLTS